MSLRRGRPQVWHRLTQIVGSDYWHTWGKWPNARPLLDETGLDHRGPEAVGGMCEMHPGCGSPKTWIDSDEEQSTFLADQVRETEALELCEVSLVEGQALALLIQATEAVRQLSDIEGSQLAGRVARPASRRREVVALICRNRIGTALMVPWSSEPRNRPASHVRAGCPQFGLLSAHWPSHLCISISAVNGNVDVTGCYLGVSVAMSPVENPRESPGDPTGLLSTVEAANFGGIEVLQVPPTRPPQLNTDTSHVTTALLLAAGAGNRLGNGAPKCLTDVSGTPILGHLISSLVDNGFKRLVVIVGYRGQQIRDYLDHHSSGLDIHYIESRRYESTNNIYSLWLARDYMTDPFLLVESDLVFDSRLLTAMRTSDRIAVAEFRSHMHGTTVSVDQSGMVASFNVGGVDGPRLPNKTINIYSLSMATWHQVTRRLELRIAAGRVHDYYESVFGEMAAQGVLPLHAVWFDDGRWSEIDTPDDLLAARNLFYEPEFAKGA